MLVCVNPNSIPVSSVKTVGYSIMSSLNIEREHWLQYLKIATGPLAKYLMRNIQLSLYRNSNPLTDCQSDNIFHLQCPVATGEFSEIS